VQAFQTRVARELSKLNQIDAMAEAVNFIDGPEGRKQVGGRVLQAAPAHPSTGMGALGPCRAALSCKLPQRSRAHCRACCAERWRLLQSAGHGGAGNLGVMWQDEAGVSSI